MKLKKNKTMRNKKRRKDPHKRWKWMRKARKINLIRRK